eukprot:scaffold18185_cov18-Prasinocladus_malaysianus.AAC.1
MDAELTPDAKLSTNEQMMRCLFSYAPAPMMTSASNGFVGFKTDGISARDEASLVEGNAIRRSQSFSETGLIDDRVKQGLRMVLRAGGSFSQVGMLMCARSRPARPSTSCLNQHVFYIMLCSAFCWSKLLVLEPWMSEKALSFRQCTQAKVDRCMPGMSGVCGHNSMAHGECLAGGFGMQASPHPATCAGWVPIVSAGAMN